MRKNDITHNLFKITPLTSSEHDSSQLLGDPSAKMYSYATEKQKVEALETITNHDQRQLKKVGANMQPERFQKAALLSMGRMLRRNLQLRKGEYLKKLRFAFRCMEGPLSKWTNVIEGWQYRWFVLDGEAGILSYYTSKEKMLKGQRRGCVRLKGAIIGIDDEDDSTFTITVDQKMFHFQARDYGERDRWIRALETTIQQHSEFYRLKYKKTHAVLPSNVFSLDLFERRISEADTYLQLMINKVKKIEAFCETAEPGEQKQAASDVVDVTHALLESFKHSIVLLQLAKNQLNPNDSLSSVKKVDASQQSQRSSDDVQRTGAGAMPLVSSAASKPVLTSSVNGEVDQETPSSRPLVFSVVSYSSSDEEEELFYDTVEESSASIDHVRTSDNECVLTEATDASSVKSSFPFTSFVDPEMDSKHFDFDAIHEDTDEDEPEDTREHGSIIMHLISQLSVGMDLTKIVLPTYILERRSLLEMYADFMTFPDLFEDINERPTEEERMIAMLRWYMSTFYGGRKSGIAKKPYNPILGEEFRCCWNSPSVPRSDKTVPGSPFPGALENQITFVGEQVSHHPPVSAFYVEHPTKHMQLTGQIWTKSKFLGLSIAVYNVGDTCLYLGDHDEEYIFNFPSAYGRSILATPWVEFGGKCSIRCNKSGYYTDIEFMTKPFYNGKAHCVRADVFRPNDKNPALTVKGQWNDVLSAKSAQGEFVFLNVRKLSPVKKICKAIAEQKNNESRKLWRYVTAALKEKDVHKATRCKFWLEQQQREEAKRRMKNNISWEPLSFYEVNERWLYRNPLKDRITSQGN